MSYKLRFVQKFKLEKGKEFLTLEKQFAEFEERNPEAPKGKRFLPYTGKEASNTLIWECDFPTLEEAQRALAFLQSDAEHEDLFQMQAACMISSYTEIYKPFDS